MAELYWKNRKVGQVFGFNGIKRLDLIDDATIHDVLKWNIVSFDADFSAMYIDKDSGDDTHESTRR